MFGVRRAGRRKPVWRVGGGGWAPVVGVACAGFVLVGGALGCLLGLAAGCGVRRWLRLRPRDRPSEEAEAGPQLPLAADLLAACIAAGAGPVEAARAVGDSLDGPVGERLARAAAELRLGGEPERAWGRLGAIPGAGQLATCLERAGASGIPAAEQMAQLATECRAEWARTSKERAHRAGVLMAAPLGLCLLPAFLVVGVVPVVIGLASGILSGG